MKEYIEERVLACANYILETNSTVRETAKNFNVSKSTVYKDVAYRLFEIDKELGEKVCSVLQINKEERHIRGGEATRKKYLK